MYDATPELSVDGFQASVTLNDVMSRTRRSVGAVGGVRSFGPRRAEARSDPTIVARNKTAATEIASTHSARKTRGVGPSCMRPSRFRITSLLVVNSWPEWKFPLASGSLMEGAAPQTRTRITIVAWLAPALREC